MPSKESRSLIVKELFSWLQQPLLADTFDNFEKTEFRCFTDIDSNLPDGTMALEQRLESFIYKRNLSMIFGEPMRSNSDKLENICCLEQSVLQEVKLTTSRATFRPDIFLARHARRRCVPRQDSSNWYCEFSSKMITTFL